jgi:hypothetical protein
MKVYHKVPPQNYKPDGYKEYGDLSFVCAFDKRLMNLNSLRINGTITTNINPATTVNDAFTTIGNAPDYGSAIVNNGDDKMLHVGTIGTGVDVGNAPNFTASTTIISSDGNKIINQAMDLRLFGEVEKAIVPNAQGGYNVVYV